MCYQVGIVQRLYCLVFLIGCFGFLQGATNNHNGYKMMAKFVPMIPSVKYNFVKNRNVQRSDELFLDLTNAKIRLLNKSHMLALYYFFAKKEKKDDISKQELMSWVRSFTDDSQSSLNLDQLSNCQLISVQPGLYAFSALGSFEVIQIFLEPEELTKLDMLLEGGVAHCDNFYPVSSIRVLYGGKHDWNQVACIDECYNNRVIYELFYDEGMMVLDSWKRRWEDLNNRFPIDCCDLIIQFYLPVLSQLEKLMTYCNG
ncbi:MAG: hypothetical protein WBQ73_01375 [Candidatus Babeliales bacterium]